MLSIKAKSTHKTDKMQLVTQTETELKAVTAE